MEIKALRQRSDLESGKRYKQFEKLLAELAKRDLPADIITMINERIDEINALPDGDRMLGKAVKRAQTAILKVVERQLKIVPKNYYRTVWTSVGMAAFGIPLGTAFGAALGNMAFLGVGLPIGLALGMAVGASMDKKASEEGRQLDLEVT